MDLIELERLPDSAFAHIGQDGTRYSTRDSFYRTAPFAVDKNDGLNFSGYAAVFNQRTQIGGWEGDFNEQLAPGAFARTLTERTPVLMFEHGRHPLLGSMPLGVISRAEEDSKGLFIEARLTDNWLIQPVRDAVRDGAITGMSFRFSVPTGGDTWVEKRGEMPLRTITDLNCTELGPVVFPAYEPTTAQIRSLVERLDTSPGDREQGALVAVTDEVAEGFSTESTRKQTVARSRDRLLALKMRGII